MDYTDHVILQDRILEWVAFPFSRASSQARDWTQVSRFAGGVFTSWATKEAQEYWRGRLSLHWATSLSRIGGGNGNPLQCSCLETPSDSGAWWAAVYGVTQSRTRLKWFSSGGSSLSLLQRIFPTQELNPSLLHCRQILYQLSYQGSPFLSWGPSLSTELLAQGYHSGSVVKNPPVSAVDPGLSPGLGRSHVPQRNHAQMLQLLSLRALQQQEKPPPGEAHTPQLESSPCSSLLEESPKSNEDPAQPK